MQKIASLGKWRYIGPQPKGKTEIPAKSSRCGSPVPIGGLIVFHGDDDRTAVLRERQSCSDH
jgi:hypothetical protein